ncbi:unnamed protein product [Adineta ricciae]|uniref:F-box domain-containing protein n=1 Tax=Adineta ricciae TaxID=249248 RepID=A0A815SI63_ADIRI|nr:unnamed protein product [Adineta ricciae]
MNRCSAFEILPDEILLNIYEYLHHIDIVYSFFNLNTRLNRIINEFCDNFNLNTATYKQFKYILSNIGSNIRSMVINGNWLSFLANEIHSVKFDSNLSLIFPNLHTLTLEYFTGEQLCTYLEKLQTPKLVKLNIKCLLEQRQDEILEQILSRNQQLKFIRFDQDSIFLSLRITNTTLFYGNIQELIVNLIDHEMLADLFTLLPNLCRLHINTGQSPFVSTENLANISPLAHLNDFKLCSIGMSWGFEEITDILCKMPSLQKLTLLLSTTDHRLVNKKNLSVILPSSTIQINFFILYYFSESSGDLDASLDTWPLRQISSTRFTIRSDRYALAHTVPFNINSMILPSIIAENILPVWKYMGSVKNLIVDRTLPSNNILMIVQHLHGIQALTIEATASQSIQSVVLHLPHLKWLKITGPCELFPILKAAPNLNDLSIDFDGFNRLINNDLLETRIKFTNLRHLVLSTTNSTDTIDSLITQALERCREEGLIYLCIKGSLSQYGSRTIRGRFADHSYLAQNDSFRIDHREKRVHLWL